MNRRQSSDDSPRGIRWSWTILGLFLLLVLPTLQLDQTAFTPREAWNAMAITDPEVLGEISSASTLPVAQQAIARTWFSFVGGPERPIRILIPWVWAISMLFLALSVRAALAADPRVPRESQDVSDGLRACLQDRGFGLVLVVGALCPLVARRDLLHPELLAVVPPSLVLGGVAWLRGRSAIWLIFALAGAALAPLVGARAAIASLMAVIIAPLCVPAGPSALRPLVFALGSLLALLGIAALRGWDLAWPVTPTLGPKAGRLGTEELFGIDRWLRLLTWAPLALLLMPTQLKELWKVGLIAGAAVIVLGQDFTKPQWEGADVAALVPLIAWAVAWHQSQHRPGRIAQVVVAFTLVCLFVAEWPTVARHLQGTSMWEQSTTDEKDDPRTALRLVRHKGVPGGRLIVHGDQRFALIWYAAHGQNPGVPLLSIPEDTSLLNLADTLRAQLGLKAKAQSNMGSEAKRRNGRDLGLFASPKFSEAPTGLELLAVEKEESAQLQRIHLQ